MKLPEIPERNIYEMKCAVYYRSGQFKVYVAKCEDSQTAFEWCKENCEDHGTFDFYYEGKQIFIEFY